MNNKPNQITIALVDGTVAPGYPLEVKCLYAKKAVITEKGTMGNLPIVDIQMVDGDGNEYFVAFTGRILTTIAEAVGGVNLRNYGTTDPLVNE